MKINLVAYGIAREIINDHQKPWDIPEKFTIKDLKSELMEKFPEFEKLRSIKFAINEEYQSDAYEIQESDEVVIIPPVSGG